MKIVAGLVYFFIFAAILMTVWNMFAENLYASDSPSTISKRKMNYGTALGITLFLMLINPVCSCTGWMKNE